MKHSKRNILMKFSLLACMIGTIFASCSQSVNVGSVDESAYETGHNVLAYITDKYGNSIADSLSFSTKDSTNLYVELSSAAIDNVKISLTYDTAVLDEYNKKHATSYQPMPQTLVSMSGDVSIEKGQKKSGAALLKYLTSDNLDSLGTYVVPVCAKVTSGSDVLLSETKSKFLLFLKDFSKLPNCNKSTGIKLISCMEINDTNPLNNLCFTLKNSGKPLIDMVILFSGYIKYNAQTKQVYYATNLSLKHILDYKEKYIKPLQDRGMKVILSVLGNGDRAGVSNLSTSAAQQFAAELKSVVEAYNLDGVFFDDEYADYSTIYPGFVASSSEAASRLCYETKKAMPDKLVMVYAYSKTANITPVDGHKVSDFIDYGLADYLSTAQYDGVPNSHLAMYSQEYALGKFVYASALTLIRKGGYAHMIFAMDLKRTTGQEQLESMQRIATYLFDDELVYDGKYYDKDW